MTDRRPWLNASTQHDPVDACSRQTIRILLETELRRILKLDFSSHKTQREFEIELV